MLQHIVLALGVAAVTAAEPVSLQLRSVSAPGSWRRLGKRAAAAASIPIGEISTTAQDLQWFATISVGTPPQNLTVLIDTGSDVLILPRNNCTTCGNITDHFDPSKSNTFSGPGNPLTIGFGTGATTVPDGAAANISGAFVADTVTFGSLTMPNQSFLLQDVGIGGLDSVAIDGILGMPPVPVAQLTAPYHFGSPLFFSFNASGQLPKPLYTLSLQTRSDTGAAAKGVLTLGDIDSAQYSGNISYVGANQTVVALAGEWIVDMTGSAINGTSVLPPGTPALALMDTGTAYVQTPDFNTTQALYAAISPAITQIDPNGAWGGPCDVMSSLKPDLSFVISDGQGGTANVSVAADSFNLGPYPGLDNICQGVFVNALQPLLPGVQFWVLGSPVLKKYFTVWDAGNLRIGFADKAGSGGGSGGASGSGTANTTGTGSGSSPSASASGKVSGNGAGAVKVGAWGVLLASALSVLLTL